MPTVSKGEEELALHCKCYGLSPQREFIFHDKRRWRFDFAFPDIKLAVEIEGITKDGGRHQRRDGFEGDAYKYNAAVKLGWRILRYTPSMVKAGAAIDDLLEMLGREPR